MRRSASEARRTRDHIVSTGVTHASSAGLSGLTIGVLAETLGMSKAGVVGPFGSRADLQAAVLAKAVNMFTQAVVEPSLTADPGLARLRVVIDSWCGYLADSPFPNGCFVTAASCELDGQPGELRTYLRDKVTHWRDFLREQIVTAQTAGDISTRLDATDLVSVLTGIAMSANQEIQLLGDDTAAARARRLMGAVIGEKEGSTTSKTA
ncbi:TetR/AcrR family transcriptional regulator [Sphaerisporangium fuscum]|uniref:TetR/AcrR family transcriptional regulator n=1 Tax=Sphaerisporangium fuscum TaxID=2835868 RepID=UPI001BDC933F|nr:TetR/AcrR family transcriptional regulator [Sphaerisporangium fuscum]